MYFQYGSDEFPHDSPVGSTRYASPKAGGALYQPEPYFDSTSGTWYSSPSSAYAPQSSASTYHHISPHLGPPHGHDHYSLSPGVTHDGHIQVNTDIFFFIRCRLMMIFMKCFQIIIITGFRIFMVYLNFCCCCSKHYHR